MSQSDREDGRESLGITMLSVLFGVAVTVALGIQAEWWVRTLVGVGVLLLLTVAIKLGTRRGSGPISKLGKWMLRR